MTIEDAAAGEFATEADPIEVAIVGEFATEADPYRIPLLGSLPLIFACWVIFDGFIVVY